MLAVLFCGTIENEFNKQEDTVVKESDEGMSQGYFLIFSKVTSSGPNNRRCARWCRCHVSLALPCVQKV